MFSRTGVFASGFEQCYLTCKLRSIFTSGSLVISLEGMVFSTYFAGCVYIYIYIVCVCIPCLCLQSNDNRHGAGCGWLLSINAAALFPALENNCHALQRDS